MSSEVKQWIKDGHKILCVLDGDQIRPEVQCPEEIPLEPIHGLKCGKGDEDQRAPGAPSFCVVKECIHEYGWELNCSGLAIMVSGLIPIEWGFDGIDPSDFYFKCAGYPSWKEADQFKQEAMDALMIHPASSITFPNEMFPMLPLRPWSEVDEETKDSLRQDILDHVEEKERKKNAQQNR